MLKGMTTDDQQRPKKEVASLTLAVSPLNSVPAEGSQPGVQESFHFMKYKKAENIIYEYADDVAPRYITSSLQLDYDTMCGADKFGNIFMTRLPSDVSAQASMPPPASLLPLKCARTEKHFCGDCNHISWAVLAMMRAGIVCGSYLRQAAWHLDGEQGGSQAGSNRLESRTQAWSCCKGQRCRGRVWIHSLTRFLWTPTSPTLPQCTLPSPALTIPLIPASPCSKPDARAPLTLPAGAEGVCLKGA